MISDVEIKEVMWEEFPRKREGYREHQESSILKIVKTFLMGRKFAILEAPTGAGKSITAYTAVNTIRRFDNGERLKTDKDGNEALKADYLGPYGLISVHTRALQVQYAATFPDTPLIWSGANYKCALEPKNPTMHWGCGECLKKKCKKYNDCDYPAALDQFLHAPLGITNYSYYLHAPFVRPFVSVIDECHNLENALCDWSKIELSTRYLTQLLTRLLKMDMMESDKATSLQKLLRSIIFLNDQKDGWADEMRSLVEATIKEIQPLHSYLNGELEELKDQFDDPKQLSSGERIHLQFMERSTQYFRNLLTKLVPVKGLKTEWVISRGEEENKDGKGYPKVEIKPLHINEIANTALFRHSHFFLLMSATVCGIETYRKYLGIKEEDAAYFAVPSTFPVEKRPIYAFTSLGKFTYKNKDEMKPKFSEFIDKWVSNFFPNVRGIIHSVSYDNAKFIQENSTQVARMAFPESADLLDLVSILEEKDNLIVVSPSVIEGLDLKDDLCRFAIFMKVPYQSLGDKWIKARSSDSQWYAQQAIVKIIQGSGRGTRSEIDYCQTFILDGKFIELWKNNRNLFPLWYGDAVKFITDQGEIVEEI